MLKKVLLVAVLVVSVMGLGAANVFAKSGTTNDCQFYNSDTGTYAAGFCDGRINAFDMEQSVAVYYTHATVQALDSNGYPYLTDQISGIQLWAIDSDNVGQPVLNVPLVKITDAMKSAKDVQIAANGAYSLNYSPKANAFWVTGPNGYSFSWKAW